MITADRHCDCCDTRTVCQATGTMRWFCSRCFEPQTGVPWKGVRGRKIVKRYAGSAPVSGKEPARKDRRERERDAKRGLS